MYQILEAFERSYIVIVCDVALLWRYNLFMVIVNHYSVISDDDQSGHRVTEGRPVSKCSNPVSGDHIYRDQSSTWKTSSVTPVVISTFILSKYPSEVSSIVSAGSSGTSNGFTASSGLTCACVIEEGSRLYIGSKRFPDSIESRMRESGSDRESGWRGTSRALQLAVGMPALEIARPPSSFPETEPSEPDQSPTPTISREERSLRTGV